MKIGVNAGSGQRPFKSTAEVRWTNIDTQDVTLDGQLYVPDVRCDLKDKWPIESVSVDYVVISHVQEHFGCGEGQSVLKESYRVLCQGGSLIIAVPDMRALAQRWLMGKMDTQLYMTNVYGAYHGDEHDRHRWGFTRESLEAELHSAAVWSQVGQFDNRVISGMDIASDWWIILEEARK